MLGLPVSSTAQMYLNSSDALFREIRDKNMHNVNMRMNELSLHYRTGSDRIKQKKAKISEIREFSKELLHIPPELLGIHVNLSREINSTCTKRDFERQMEVEQELVFGNPQVKHVSFTGVKHPVTVLTNNHLYPSNTLTGKR